MDDTKVTKNPLVVAFGNPLLDICIQAPENEDICTEFGLALDGEAEVSSTVALQLAKRTSNLPKVQRCGGSVLNTARILKWLLGNNDIVIFSGSIGRDSNGKVLEQMSTHDKVEPKFVKHADLPTGTVTVLVHGVHRSLFAYIGAAQVYDEESLTDDLLSDVRTSKIAIMEAYFSFHNMNVASKVAFDCQKSGTCLVVPLGSVYLYENPTVGFLNLIRSADILLGNEREFRAVGKAIGIDSPDIEDILIAILGWNYSNDRTEPLKLRHLRSKGKVVICTRGKEATICCEQASGAVLKVPVPPVDDIVDGTGAGDSFGSGVLLGVLLQKDFITSIQLGIYASSEILKQVGCAVPRHTALTKDPNSKIGALLT